MFYFFREDLIFLNRKDTPQYFCAKKPFDCDAQKAFDFFIFMHPLSPERVRDVAELHIFNSLAL
jgi:hypothetical protein